MLGFLHIEVVWTRPVRKFLLWPLMALFFVAGAVLAVVEYLIRGRTR